MIETETVRQRMIGWMQDLIDAGATPEEASRACTKRIKKEKIADLVISELGPGWLRDLWMESNRDKRDRALRQEPGERRVGLDALRAEDSAYAALYRIGPGDWRPLGDLGKAECARVSTERHERAIGNEREARFFARLAMALNEEQNVRARFTEEELRALKAECDAE